MPAPTCATSDVAGLIPERTGGNGADFDANSTPTATQVTAIIAQVIQEVVAVVGPTVDASLAAFATLTVATGVAAQVELAFTNETSKDTDSKFDWLQEQYHGKPPPNMPNKVGGRLGLLADAQAKIADGGQPGIADPATPWAVFDDATQPGFPVTTWRTRF